MEALFHELLDWVGENPGWAYVVVFIVGMTESLAVIGVVVPGVIILIGAGALVAAGAIGFWPTFLAAVAGAILGDALSYALGRHFNQSIRDTWPFSHYPEQLAQGEAFFHRYGGWSVALGRFFGPIRAMVPVVAGMMRMPAGRFYVANIGSAFAQIFSYLVPGMLFGASLQLAAEAAVRLAVLSVGLIGGLWLAGWFIHRLYSLVAPHAGATVGALLRWADLHPQMGRIAHALADPEHPDARALAGLALLLILGVLVTGVLGGAALMGPSELTLNRAALDLGQSLHTPLADRLMVGLAQLGDPWVLVPAGLVVFGFLLLGGGARQARYWPAALAFPLVATPVLGSLLRVPRPDLGLDLTLPWSFPSGPVLLATCFYGFLAVMTAPGLIGRLRWMPYATASMLVAAVAWARVYFGAEWLTDLIASIGLGLAWVAALGLALRRHSRRDPRALVLVAVTISALTAAFLALLQVRGEAQLTRLQPAHRTLILSESDWLAGAWRTLPERRADLSQSGRHRLDFQYAGDPQTLSATLTGLGWAAVETLRWGNALHLLSPSLPLAKLPVVPQVHDGHHEALVMALSPTPDSRQVLRLWSTPYRLTDGRDLWVGNLTDQRKEVLLHLAAFPATELDSPPGRTATLDAIAGGLPRGARLLVPTGDSHEPDARAVSSPNL